MKKLFILVLSLVALPALARPNTQNLTCAQASDLVKKSGSIVLTTADGMFAKFVSDGRYCERTQHLAPAYVPTRDQDECWIGYVCASKDSNGAQIFPRHPLTSCSEGQEAVFTVPGPGDHDQREIFVCRAGKWEQKFGGSTGGSVGEPLACKEGQEQLFFEQGSGDHDQRVLYVCRSGKWVKEF